MCESCGCVLETPPTGQPDDDHGDPRNITESDLRAAAAAQGISVDQVVQNIVDTRAATQQNGGTKSMDVIRKSLRIIPGTTKVVDAEQGIVEAYVNTTAIEDLQRDIMEPGCWQDVIKAADSGDIDRPSTVWGHDWAITTGNVLSAVELQPGDPSIPEKIAKDGAGALKITAQYNLDTQRGREAFSDVSKRVIKQWSVGFIPDQASITWEKGIRRIGRVLEWPEVSNVLVGASPNTATTSAKAADVPSEDADERKARAAARLERAREILRFCRAWGRMIGKSKLDTEDAREAAKYKLRDSDGKVKYPINDCADVEDAWGLRGSSSIPKDKVERHVRNAASKLGCDGPWNDDSGKATEETERKADGDMPGLPALTDDEAQHNGPLQQALDGIKTLIAQECSEPGYSEFDDIVALACVGKDLLRWARGEQSEYGASPYSIWDMFDAGREALDRKTEAMRLALSAETLAAFAYMTQQPTEAEGQSTQHDAPEDDESDGLTHYARRMSRPNLRRLLSEDRRPG